MRGGAGRRLFSFFESKKQKKMKDSNMFSSVEAASASCAPASNPSQGSHSIQTEIPARRLHRFDCFILLFAFLSFLFFFTLCGAEQLRIRTERSRSGPGGKKKIPKKIKSQCGFAQRFTSLTTRLSLLPCVRSFRSRFFLLLPAETPTGHPSPSASPPPRAI